MQSAVVAGAVAAACVIAIPAGMLDLALSSLGLSEAMAVLVAPVGWPVRIALAVLAAAICAVAAGPGRQAKATQAAVGVEGRTTMGWAQTLGLHHLARLARGEDVAIGRPAARFTAPRSRRASQESGPERLARHKADLHPDAPPRTPLMASRDLPQLDAAIVRTREARSRNDPRPLPRAPDPLSDTDLHDMWTLLKDSPADRGLSVAARPAAEPPVADSGEGAPLMSLLDRFEQGIAHRVALRDAADARSRLDRPDMGSTAPLPVAQPTPDIDAALNAALATLRKLSAKADNR